MTLRLCFFSFLLLLPLFASAGPAADFAAASRAQQAELLQQWAAAPDVSLLPLLQALKAETVVTDQDRHPFSQTGNGLQPLDTSSQPKGALKKLFMNNRLRVLVASALAAHQLVSSDASVRLSAAQQLQNDAAADLLPLITQRLSLEKDARVHAALAMAAASLQLSSPQPLFGCGR